MKSVIITISGNNIHYDAAGITLPEFYRAVNWAHFNLSAVAVPTKIEIDENNQMVVTANEKPPIRLSGEPAVFKIDLVNSFPSGGNIDMNGESKIHIINCLEYLLHLSSKQLLTIATELLGVDQQSQEKWIERVLNKNII